jgi:hypothetical protein
MSAAVMADRRGSLTARKAAAHSGFEGLVTTSGFPQPELGAGTGCPGSYDALSGFHDRKVP